jgi:hypothetical protein
VWICTLSSSFSAARHRGGSGGNSCGQQCSEGAVVVIGGRLLVDGVGGEGPTTTVVSVVAKMVGHTLEPRLANNGDAMLF